MWWGPHYSVHLLIVHSDVGLSHVSFEAYENCNLWQIIHSNPTIVPHQLLH